MITSTPDLMQTIDVIDFRRILKAVCRLTQPLVETTVYTSFIYNKYIRTWSLKNLFTTVNCEEMGPSLGTRIPSQVVAASSIMKRLGTMVKQPSTFYRLLDSMMRLLFMEKQVLFHPQGSAYRKTVITSNNLL